MPNAQRYEDFAHDSAETFGFLASPSARSYNKRVYGSRGCTPSAQIFNNSKKGVFRFKKKKENTYIHLWTLGYECDYHGFKECDPQC